MRTQTRITLLGLVFGGALVAGARPMPGSNPTDRPISTDQIVRFVKERFGLKATATLTASPFSASVSPEFDKTTLTIGDGNPQHDRTQTVYVSKKGLCLVVGNIFRLESPGARSEILRHFIETFKIKPTGPHDGKPAGKVELLEF